MSERGQTVHDYLLGILIVLLTLTGVFAFFPDVFAPFEEEVTDGEWHMSDRLADRLIEANNTFDDERTIDFVSFNRTLRDSTTFGVMLDRAGIPGWKQVNVTVRGVDGSAVFSSVVGPNGSTYRAGFSDPTATEVRNIQAHNRSSPCYESCQLIVRVWTGG